MTIRNHAEYVANKRWSLGWDGRQNFEVRRNSSRNLYLVKMRESRVDRSEVLLHNRVAALAIGLLDVLLDLLDRLFARQECR